MPLPPIPEWSHPIRMPAGLPLAHAEPACATVSTLGAWKLPFVLACDVPPGTALHLQIQGGRNNRGGFRHAQVEKPGAEGFLSAAADGAPLAMQTVKPNGEFRLALPEAGLPRGARVTVTLGDTSRGSPGIRTAPGYVHNKFFVLFTAPPETGPNTPPWAGGGAWNDTSAARIVAVCTMHVLGGALHRLRAYAPAVVRPGEPFPLLVRPEDKRGNLTALPDGPLTVTLDGAAVPAEREAVPGSSCVRLTVTLARPGVYRLEVAAPAAGKRAVANPVRCAPDATPVCWGMIHGHTEMSDGSGTLDQYFRQLRHDVLLDFAATADHDHLWETPDSFWAATQAAVERWNQPGEFAALLGYEWAKWRKNGDGDRNVYYRAGNRPLYRSDEGHYPRPPDLFAALHQTGEQAIVIPHHPGHGGNFCDWKDHDPAFERLVEIFQLRGSYECPPDEDNPAPEIPGKVPPFPTGTVRHALAAGWRVGFTAGGDDHRGDWGTEASVEGAYKQGLMSVAAEARTREALFDAMYQRRVVATTGPRILLDWTLNGLPLGAEARAADRPGVETGRLLKITCHGTAPIERIDVIRNNRVIHSEPGRGRLDMELEWTDTDPLSGTWLPPAPHCPHPFTFYYVRAIQTDGEVAWASPIWLDP